MATETEDAGLQVDIQKVIDHERTKRPAFTSSTLSGIKVVTAGQPESVGGCCG
jgi:hypothetical protein